VVNDNGVDRTEKIVRDLGRTNHAVQCVSNDGAASGLRYGVGLPIFGATRWPSFMADASDAPTDLVAFYRKLREGYDCVFGSRFSRSGRRPTRMPLEQGAHLWVPVRGIIVEDSVDQLAGRHDGFDPVENADEFLMAVARHDHGTAEDIERGKQCGGAVPDTLVGHRSGPPPFHRQTRLSTVEA
jgi:hypothetical protein